MSAKELYEECLAKVPIEISREVNAHFDCMLKTIIKEELFKKITNDFFETYKRKNNDYGDSFAKLFKKSGMRYSLDHFQEKINRIEALQSKENKVKGESYVDSLKDLAVYAILTLIELKMQDNVDI